jgi:hypothetical protein
VNACRSVSRWSIVNTDTQTFDCRLLAMKSSAACFDICRPSVSSLSNTSVTRLTWRLGSGASADDTGPVTRSSDSCPSTSLKA